MTALLGSVSGGEMPGDGTVGECERWRYAGSSGDSVLSSRHIKPFHGAVKLNY